MDNDTLLVFIKDMFDKMEQRFDKKIDDVKTHTGVLFEKLQGDIKAVAEGHDLLNRKIDRSGEELGGKIDRISSVLKDDVKSLKSDMAVVKDYVTGVDTKLNEHEMILKK